jgi:hypothetical protein
LRPPRLSNAAASPGDNRPLGSKWRRNPLKARKTRKEMARHRSEPALEHHLLE